MTNSAIAFPLRLQRAQLRKTSESDAYHTLLWLMARTPRGSWSACASFGFRDSLSAIWQMMLKVSCGPEKEMEMCALLVEEINVAFEELGLTQYKVSTITLYAPPCEMEGMERALWLHRSMETISAIVLLQDQSNLVTTELIL